MVKMPKRRGMPPAEFRKLLNSKMELLSGQQLRESLHQ